MKDELIRDRLVVGIKDVTLPERLQTDETLKLDKAKKLVRHKKAVREQQNILKREETTLDYIKSKGKVPRTHQQTASEHKKFIRCGKNPTPGKTAQQRTLNVTIVENMATVVQCASQRPLL